MFIRRVKDNFGSSALQDFLARVLNKQRRDAS